MDFAEQFPMLQTTFANLILAGGASKTLVPRIRFLACREIQFPSTDRIVNQLLPEKYVGLINQYASFLIS